MLHCGKGALAHFLHHAVLLFERLLLFSSLTSSRRLIGFRCRKRRADLSEFVICSLQLDRKRTGLINRELPLLLGSLLSCFSCRSRTLSLEALARTFL